MGIPENSLWSAILVRLTRNQRKGVGGLIDLSNAPQFFEFACAAFCESGPISAEGKALLDTAAVSWAMLLPGGLSREQARELATRIQRADDVDLRLIQTLNECVEETSEENIEIILRGLDLIDHIGVKARLFHALVKFTKHPDSKVRSKAARIVGQITVSQGWVERQMAVLEPRVRSNVLEALAENPKIPETQMEELLRNATHDPHHRVAVTALFLMARRGDAESLQLLEALPGPSLNSNSCGI